MKRFLLLTITIILCGYLTAQNNSWEVFLGGQTVKCIDFDNENIWAATDSFLISINKLNKSIQYYPYPGTINGVTNILQIDNNGVKWIVQSEVDKEAVNVIYSFSANKWDKIELNAIGTIGSFAIDKYNNKWLTAGEISRHLYKLEQGRCTQYDTKNSELIYDFVQQVVSDSDGNLWMSNFGNRGSLFTADIALIKNDGDDWIPYLYGSGVYLISNITIDNNGNPWFVQPISVSALNELSTSWSVQINLDWPNYMQLHLIEKDSICWFSNDEGIAVYNGNVWSYYSTSNSEMPSNTIYKIAIDTDGTKWIATSNGLVSFKKSGLVSSIETDISVMDEIELFPNPARNFITLKLPQGIQNSNVYLLNLNGQVIQSFNVNDKQKRLDLSWLTPGVYLLNIQTDKNQMVKKFVKQ
ncbi:T9SS type A sorting domain-containing protein [uncultured Draconibacterium sp.]|uniref:T9SS type A sorting domain-containing protein n=1 Tax=uncultured Draconibacterium sp. TaxID=1573823 RepID=UPI0025E04FCE|nr:T9SS type A sorting domain-containing protein [uncultured Draconibacterium sp.]